MADTTRRHSSTLLIGSHLDSVVNAGKYDGPLGVLIGLALVELLNECRVRLPTAIAVVAFSEEEGVRFQTPYIGSRALVGDLSAELLDRCDAGGIKLSEALQSFGCPLDQLPAAEYDARNVVAFIEPHIEQGPELERARLPVGVVSGIAGQTRAHFQFVGRAAHAGTTPMSARHDALAASAKFIVEIEELARGRAGLVATVGHLEVLPNVANVIPGEVHLRLDLRHPDDDTRDAAFREIIHRAALVAEDREVEFDMLSSQQQNAMQCDPRCAELLEQAIAEAGIQPQRLVSGAGHDAVIMAKRFPTAMLFIRCAGGISHHPDESVATDDVAKALEVLWRFATQRLATLPGVSSS